MHACGNLVTIVALIIMRSGSSRVTFSSHSYAWTMKSCPAVPYHAHFPFICIQALLLASPLRPTSVPCVYGIHTWHAQ